MDIRLVVFDLDGTLIGAPKSFQEIKEELRQRLISTGISEEMVGDLTPMYENLERIARETGRDFEELHRILIDLELKRMEESYPFDGARELLSFLKESGVKVALMTRSPREAALRALEMHDLIKFFDLISARDDVSVKDVKPNDGQLRAIMEEFNVPASKTVVVGDHGYDVIPANRVGALSVMITGHESGRMSFQIAERATFEVKDLMHARELFRRLLNTYVVVPAYNEERTIGNVLDSLLEYFRPEEVIVVNDGSRDRTEEIARSKGVRVVRHIINRGLGGALGTGIKYALLKGAEIIVTFDADGQHLTSDALRVMAPVAEGRADFAVGSRLKGDISEMPFVKRFGNFVLDSITALFATRYVSDSQSGLRCFNRECASKVRITCDRYAVSSEIIIEVSKARCRIVEVPIKAIYTEYAMRKGTNVLEGIKIALNLLLDKLR